MTPSNTSTDLATVSEYRALTMPRDELQTALDALRDQEVSEFDLTHIKVPGAGGTTWEIPGTRGTESTRSIEAVIVFEKFTRSYWPRAYTGGGDAPACSSPDGRFATARPIPDPEDPDKEITLSIPADQDEHGRYICDTCKFSEYGTATDAKTGKPTRGQACKQARPLFLLLPDRLLPAVLTLPPTSLKPAKTYFLGLIDEGLAAHRLITQLTLEKTKNAGGTEYSLVKFQAGELLAPEQAARAAEYRAAARPQFERATTTASDLPDVEQAA